jgi:hypothetical protein
VIIGATGAKRFVLLSSPGEQSSKTIARIDPAIHLSKKGWMPGSTLAAVLSGCSPGHDAEIVARAFVTDSVA